MMWIPDEVATAIIAPLLIHSYSTLSKHLCDASLKRKNATIPFLSLNVIT